MKIMWENVCFFIKNWFLLRFLIRGWQHWFVWMAVCKARVWNFSANVEFVPSLRKTDDNLILIQRRLRKKIFQATAEHHLVKPNLHHTIDQRMPFNFLVFYYTECPQIEFIWFVKIFTIVKFEIKRCRGSQFRCYIYKVFHL